MRPPVLSARPQIALAAQGKQLELERQRQERNAQLLLGSLAPPQGLYDMVDDEKERLAMEAAMIADRVRAGRARRLPSILCLNHTFVLHPSEPPPC